MANTLAGIIHNGGVANGPNIHLPLEQLAAHALILDVSSRTTVTQRYYNPFDEATSRALYCFPVPACAAVCSFELRTSSGRVLSGICKEKSKAKEEHDQAIGRGEYTGLLEWISDDTFTISIGSIAAKETVYVKLIYVMSLMNGHNRDDIRFYLPMAIGERYGPPTEGLINASVASSLTRIRLKVDVQTSGTILSIHSPTHAVAIKKYNTHLGRPSRRRYTVRFRSNTFLVDDFVLVVQAENLDCPRCFAEVYRDPKKQVHDTLAIQLTIVPKFDLPPRLSQEYIFLIDRSGSMNGTRMEAAKKTLILLLRMIPRYGSTFNIFSFGDHVDSLWSLGNQYSQSNLDDATGHVETMTANYGGTEILAALDRAFKWRQRTSPTAVFVLTDGESTDIEETVRLVQEAVQDALPSAPLRVYTLGIGDQVSSAMCEGIAKAGNGACLFSTSSEDITAKCARLLRAGRTPFVRNITVDWGVPSKYLVSPAASTTSLQSDCMLPTFQQAPTFIHDIHADVRLVAYALFQLRKPYAPREVTILGEVEETGQPFRLVVPIRGVQLADPDPQIPIIHTLTGAHLIKEHETGRAPLPFSISASDPESRKRAIVSLGTTYQLASRHTSFVATEKGSRNVTKRDRHPQGLLGTLQSILASADPPTDTMSMADFPIPGKFPRGSSRGAPSVAGSQHGHSRQIENDEDSDGTADTYSTMSSLNGSSASSHWTETETDELEAGSSLQRSPSPQLAPAQYRHEPESEAPHVVGRARAVPAQVSDLLSLQKFDGSFALNGSMKLVVGELAANEGAALGVPAETWATVLCIAFLEKHLAEQHELRSDLLMKAYEYIESKGITQIDFLVSHAKALLV